MTETNSTHPFVARVAGARAIFEPEINDIELQQMQDTCDDNPDASEDELNKIISKEFGLVARHEAFKARGTAMDEMTEDLTEFLVKWNLSPMVNPIIMAGGILHYLQGVTAVFGAFLEEQMSANPHPPDEE